LVVRAADAQIMVGPIIVNMTLADDLPQRLHLNMLLRFKLVAQLRWAHTQTPGRKHLKHAMPYELRDTAIEEHLSHKCLTLHKVQRCY